MLIECPNCATKYNLSSVAIGSEGRDMKCAKCAHEWFEAPRNISALNEENTSSEKVAQTDFPDVEDQISKLNAILNDETTIEDEFGEVEEDPRDTNDNKIDNEQEDDTNRQTEAVTTSQNDDSIPDSVKPTTEHSPALTPSEGTRKPNNIGAMAILTSLFLAFIIMLALPSSALFFKDKIVKMAPFTAGIYEMAGIALNMKGEGFVIESLDALIVTNSNNTDSIELKGRIVNMTDKPMSAPKMLATLQNKEGKESESWFIAPPKGQIAPGESFTFVSDYPTVPKNTNSVNLTFKPEFSH